MQNTSNSGPLAGVRVVDFSTLLPGPYASMLLVNMGADVVKVESPTRPDLVKVLPPMVGDQSAADLQLNRGKRSIAVDLKTQAGREIAHKLIAESDVLLEQFRPGVMERLGLGYKAVSARAPALVYCSLTGYGQTGPWAHRAGHDINYLSIAGVSSYTGRIGDAPVPHGIQWADIAGGSHHAVMGILAALLESRASGAGSHIDISMTDAMFAMNGVAGAAALATGIDPAPQSEMLNGGSFYDYYRCADGAFLAVGGLEPQFVKTLAELLGRPDLLGLQELHNESNQRSLKFELQVIFAEKPRGHWLVLFGDADVCITPVLTINEAADHEQLRARHMTVPVNDRSEPQLGDPIKFLPLVNEPRVYSGAPKLGEHSAQELLRLGYSETDISELQARGIVKALSPD
ncbi:MAG: CaiB/BaiF CoA-transferase family protein [Pseudomonadota bacterium]